MKLQEYNAPEVVPVSRKGAGGLYLCDDVDPVIRGLKSSLLESFAVQYQREAERAPFDNGCYRGMRLLLHYAQLIRENKPGWWQS